MSKGEIDDDADSSALLALPPRKPARQRSARAKFRAPAYVGDRLLVEGAVMQRSVAGGAIVVRINISVPEAARVVATANAVVGFTAERLQNRFGDRE